MSISTPGGAPERVPSTVSTDKKPGAGNPPAGARTGGARPAGNRPGGKPSAGGKGGNKPRKPIAAVKATGGRNWGPIAVVGVVVLIAVGIIGYGAIASMNGPKTWEDRAGEISGIQDFRKSDPELVKGSQHQAGPIKYTQSPPVAGPHNARWQNCMGDVYSAPIANEHAVHALEHGSVWITYKLGMPADQVAKLAEKVQGQEKMLMSPVEGLSSNVSLQAWGYQLKVDSVDDSRIDEFIRTLRVNASIEGATAACDGGITTTGTVPQDA